MQDISLFHFKCFVSNEYTAFFPSVEGVRTISGLHLSRNGHAQMGPDILKFYLVRKDRTPPKIKAVPVIIDKIADQALKDQTVGGCIERLVALSTGLVDLDPVWVGEVGKPHLFPIVPPSLCISEI